MFRSARAMSAETATQTEEYAEEPCQWRIVDDCGSAFAMGLIGSAVYLGVKGFRNSPAGLNRRLIGGLTAVKETAPYVGGYFFVWGGIYSIINCALMTLRKTQDPWNSVASGAATSAILAANKGWRTISGHAFLGGACLALIEGGIMLYTRFSNEVQPKSLTLEDNPVSRSNEREEM